MAADPRTGGTGDASADAGDATLDAVLERLYATVLERKAGRGATEAEGNSYVRSLLTGGAPKIAGKLLEEACELTKALAFEDDAHLTAEAADLIFHLLVALAHRDVPLAAVAAELRRREGRSGLDEKRARGSSGSDAG